MWRRLSCDVLAKAGKRFRDVMRLRDIKPCVTIMTVRLGPLFTLQRGRKFDFGLRVFSASRFSRLANAVITGFR
jgi:hypothetical protein